MHGGGDAPTTGDIIGVAQILIIENFIGTLMVSI